LRKFVRISKDVTQDERFDFGHVTSRLRDAVADIRVQRVPLCAATSSAARRPAMMIRLNDADRPALHAWMASELAAM
jgi:hypothetical protein